MAAVRNNNPYLEQASVRCEQWKTFHRDYNVLRQLVRLESKPIAERVAALDTFLGRYQGVAALDTFLGRYQGVAASTHLTMVQAARDDLEARGWTLLPAFMACDSVPSCEAQMKKLPKLPGRELPRPASYFANCQVNRADPRDPREVFQSPRWEEVAGIALRSCELDGRDCEAVAMALGTGWGLPRSKPLSDVYLQLYFNAVDERLQRGQYTLLSIWALLQSPRAGLDLLRRHPRLPANDDIDRSIIGSCALRSAAPACERALQGEGELEFCLDTAQAYGWAWPGTREDFPQAAQMHQLACAKDPSLCNTPRYLEIERQGRCGCSSAEAGLGVVLALLPLVLRRRRRA